MLAAMFAPDGPFSFTKSSTSDSTPFIDRDGELLKYILQFLRGGHINLPDAFRSDDRKALRFEAEYYGLDGLLDELNSADGLIPALHEGSPMLRCARVVYGVDASNDWDSQSYSIPTCKYRFGAFVGTLLSGVVFVPSTCRGKLCYAITYAPKGKSESGHKFDNDNEDDIISTLHADVQWSANDRVLIEKRVAKITSEVVQQLDWKPLIVPEGHTTARALTDLLSLLCNGADEGMLPPSAFEYSWSIVHVQPRGAKRGQLVGGAISENSIEEASYEVDDDNCKVCPSCEAIAAQVERYWQRAADAFVTYAGAHSGGPDRHYVQCDAGTNGDDSNVEGGSSSSKKATTKKSKKKRARTTTA
jgi:BTB/POZ domain